MIAEKLNKLLADTFTLYLKTHGYHWNVTGNMFPPLHSLFESQYSELWESVDTIAERIRALDSNPIFTLTKIYETTSVEESDDIPEWKKMVSNLIKDRQDLSKFCREIFKLATDESDDVTANFMLELAMIHDKQIWMLKSIIS